MSENNINNVVDKGVIEAATFMMDMANEAIGKAAKLEDTDVESVKASGLTKGSDIATDAADGHESEAVSIAFEFVIALETKSLLSVSCLLLSAPLASSSSSLSSAPHHYSRIFNSRGHRCR